MNPGSPIDELTLPRILPLQNGDSLTSGEFLRRFEGMPAIKKAELIEGVVYMSSPVSAAHSEPDGVIHTWLGFYAAHTPAVRFHPNTSLILDVENTFQPDALLRLDPERGGKSRLNEQDYLEGAPELVLEIALTSASIDLRGKRRAYERNGIAEYLVWVVADRTFHWFRLESSQYIEQKPDDEGILHSRIFPGLRLPLESLLALDAAAVLRELQKGLHSPEHQAFVRGEPRKA